MNEKNGIVILFIVAVGMIFLNPNRDLLNVAEEDQSAKANAYFEKVFQDGVDRSPEFKMWLGIKEDQGHWDDNSDRASALGLARAKRELRWLKSNIDYGKLDPQTRLSYDLFAYERERNISNHKYRYHNYPFNQMFGLQSGIPADLISMHKVENVRDAENYISRLRRVPILFKHALIGLEKRRSVGIIPPEFVFPHVLRDSRNVISNEPFEDTGVDGTILSDFRKKVNALDIKQRQRDRLMIQAERALVKQVQPSYEKLITYFEELQNNASPSDGVWDFPDGENFYNARLVQLSLK